MSTFGGEVCNRAKRARTIQKEQRQMVNLLSSELDHTEDDVRYIVDQVNGPQRHNATKLATILRKGILDKLLAGGTDEEDDTLGAKQTKFRNLQVSQVVSLIVFLVPQLGNKRADLTAVGRPKLMSWLLFGLGVKETTELPTDFPTLRSLSGLGAFCAVRHQKLGARLAPLATVADLSDFTLPGYFSIDKSAGREDRCELPQERWPACLVRLLLRGRQRLGAPAELLDGCQALQRHEVHTSCLEGPLPRRDRCRHRGGDVRLGARAGGVAFLGHRRRPQRATAAGSAPEPRPLCWVRIGQGRADPSRRVRARHGCIGEVPGVFVSSSASRPAWAPMSDSSFEVLRSRLSGQGRPLAELRV